jgi:hypothetical protein
MSPGHVVIVRRKEDALYAELTSRPWREVVTVTWGRRQGDRRMSTELPPGDQRHGDRRRAPPDTWTLVGFVVVSDPGATS